MATISDDLVGRLRSRNGEAITRVERIMDEAANRIEAQNELIQEMRKAILSMVYDDNGVWRAGVIGDMEAPAEVGIALSKAKSQQEGEIE